AGRVQSVAVRIICKREKEIEEFISKEYWTISAKFIPKEKKLLEAKLTKINGKKAKIATENEAEEILQKLIKESFSVTKIEEKIRRKSPEPPFITSTLQQVGGYYLKFPVAKIMKLAQDLYEGQNVGGGERVGLITYMRTDSVRIAKEAELEARDYIDKEIGKDFLPEKIPRYKNRKSSQEAHEAIRPTSIWRTPEKMKKHLSKDHLKLYDLIWKRFTASQMKKAILKIVTMDIQGGGYLFQAEGERVDFPGFTLIYKKKKEKILPPLIEGTKIGVKEAILEQHFTQSPSHYTESSLVKTLEEEGIGRPSTYAPIISTIKAREYVKWKRGKLISTLLAKVVNELLMKNFSTILDIKFTAKMEENLDEVEQKKKRGAALIDEFYKHFKHDLEIAEKKMKNIKKGGIPVGEVKCKVCGKNMVLKFGRYGEFLACSDYPHCKNTEPLPPRIIMKCPCPDCEGEIVEKVSKKGRTFYGCSKFPKCRFISSEEPVEEKCPYCGNPYVIKIKGKLKCPHCKKTLKDSIIKEKRAEGIAYKIIKKRKDASKLDKRIYSIS
ncbi:MAG: type I DNA topoisomerase, partial [Candidatus Aerophobetes bacterium]|nr:type I DNA topoisomerase [Candidatus Aerophobetes bacterium]